MAKKTDKTDTASKPEAKVDVKEEKKLATATEVAEKLKKGGTLSEEEKVELMSEPNEEPLFPSAKEEDPFDVDVINIDDEKKETSDAKKKDEEPAQVAEEEKPAPPAEKKGDVPEVKESPDMGRVEQELAKPDGAEDLSKFSKSEQGLFWSLRRERRARQLAEQERDTLKFERVQKEQAAKKEEIPDIKLADDDFVSFADLKKVVKKAEEKSDAATTLWRNQYLKRCEEVAQEKFDDYPEVVECVEDIFSTTPSYQKEVVERMFAGENPAIVMYGLIKGDPRFEKVLPIARAKLASRGIKSKEPAKPEVKAEEVKPVKTEEQLRKEREAMEAERRLEENKERPKTSAHHGGGEGVEAEMTLEDYASMSPAKFRALSKEKREAILRKFGVG